MTTSSHLRVDRSADGIAVLTLDNPDQRNAMSDEMTAAWVAAIDDLAGDRGLRAVVVTGAGTAFCSGGNTGWIASEPDAEVDYLRTRMIAFYRAPDFRRGQDLLMPVLAGEEEALRLERAAVAAEAALDEARPGLHRADVQDDSMSHATSPSACRTDRCVRQPRAMSRPTRPAAPEVSAACSPRAGGGR